MSNTAQAVRWCDEAFKSAVEAEGINRYWVADCLVYMRRWLELNGLELPAISASSHFEFIGVTYAGQSICCSSRSEVANAINLHWRAHLAILGQPSSILHDDELIEEGLHSSTAQIEAEDASLLERAIECGRSNPWIRRACDPAFTKRSFAKVRSIAALERAFRRGNWSLGSAFVYRNLAFINQVNGGDEWLVIRQDAGAFESWSAGHALAEDPSAVFDFVHDCLAATSEELHSLDYSGARFKQL